MISLMERYHASLNVAGFPVNILLDLSSNALVFMEKIHGFFIMLAAFLAQLKYATRLSICPVATTQSSQPPRLSYIGVERFHIQKICFGPWHLESLDQGEMRQRKPFLGD